jgi:cytochrome c-type biogenesis protein CcsB
VKDVLLNPALDHLALYTIFAAMAVYTVAFLVFVWHLSRLSSTSKSLQKTAARLERSAFGIMIFAAVLHGAGVIMRGISADRVPWANMYEFSITGSFVLVAIFLLAWGVKEIRVIAVFVTAFALLVLGSATTLFYVQVKTLMPALQSYWLVIHVTVAVLATAFFNIAAALAVAYLLRSWGWLAKSKLPVAKLVKRVLSVFPESKKLENLSHRFNMIGFILWSFTLVAGAIWAERAWHRFWGWDTKEVWTFIIWTLYAGYLHATATRGWNGARAAWLSLVGFAAILFNFTIVNLFFKGLHVYSGLK